MPTEYNDGTTVKDVRPRFGVEIEFVGLADRACREVNNAGLPCYDESYNHNTVDYWKIVPDASCGRELVSPPLQWEDRNEVRVAMRALSRAGARTTVDCGLHVHHEWPWWNNLETPDSAERLDRLVTMYEKMGPALEHLLSESRMQSQYAQKNSLLFKNRKRWGYMPELMEFDGDDRFAAINGHSLNKYGTIEFRQHQGTLNPAKTLAWVELTRQLVHAASMPVDLLDGDGCNDDMDIRWKAVFGKISTSTYRYCMSRTDGQWPDLVKQITRRPVFV